jgi:hypothetical protein
MSSDAEVVQLFGSGKFDPAVGDTGARVFIDSSKSATLVIEYGTDRVVSSVEVRKGIPSGLTASLTKRMVASRFRPTAGIGVWFGIHLGDTPEKVRENLGSPASTRTEGEQEVWTYQSACACELEAGFTFRFANQQLVSFSVWELNG